MKKIPFTIAVNATMCYISAFLLTTILHELGHALCGLALDSGPILHHNYVAHTGKESVALSGQVAIALAGPLISLIQGVIFATILLRSSQRSIIHLLCFWLAVLGFTNFLGYLMTTPFFVVGDLGKAFALLGYSLWSKIVAASLGAGALLFVAYHMTLPALSFSPEAIWLVDSKNRKRFSLHIIILPWLMGSAVVTLLYLPIIAIISIIYPVMSGMVFIFPWQNAENPKGLERLSPTTQTKLVHFSYGLLVLMLGLIIIFRLVLAPGIAL